MADLDIEKISNALANVVTGYVSTFFGILIHPRKTIQEALAADGTLPLQGAIRYAAISILLGISIATFLKLPGVEGVGIPQAALSILFFWIAVAGFVHALMRLLRVQGAIGRTSTAFLYAVGTTHPLWVLAAALAAPLITDTRVTLTYDYVIFMGDSAIKRETFVREKEPEKDKTVLPPLADSARPFQSQDRSRISIDQSSWPKPKREEVAFLNQIGIYAAVAYAVVAAIYSCVALAAAYSLATWRVVVLLILLSPMPIGVFILGIAIR
jgi:hypothetical protein